MFRPAVQRSMPFADHYPLREPSRDGKVERWLQARWDHLSQTLAANPLRQRSFVRRVQARAEHYALCTESEIDDALRLLRLQAQATGVDQHFLVESFALVREVSGRTLGMRHYPKQLLGGWILMHGMVAEMETGQGKTLTAALAAAAAAIAGIAVHVITVNDYLAQRDADTLRPLYRRLGMTLGVVVEGDDNLAKQQAYRCSVTYCTNKTVAFDHLRDRMVMAAKPSKLQLQLEALYHAQPRSTELVLPGLCFAIVDEADSVLVDEAVTPLIISAQTDQREKLRIYQRAIALAEQLREGEHYQLIAAERKITLTAAGRDSLAAAAERIGGLWRSALARDELILQALRARHLFLRDKHYIVSAGKIQIVDEFTGRVMADRTWERGLHQMIEVIEGCAVTGDRETLARISYQRFFRRYYHLAGMTGTASEVGAELSRVYGLKVVKVSPQQALRRRYLPARYERCQHSKWRAVVQTIATVHATGQPVLVGTRTVAASELLSEKLNSAGLAHHLLNARQDQSEAEKIAAAGQIGAITVATNMAGRGTDITLSDAARGCGGLCVLVTELHESARIDRQLMGRCARQGDPGTVRVIVAADDELVRTFAPRALTAWVSRLPRLLGADLLLRRLYLRAQRRCEKSSYTSRQQVQKMDEYYNRMLAFTGKME